MLVTLDLVALAAKSSLFTVDTHTQTTELGQIFGRMIGAPSKDVSESEATVFKRGNVHEAKTNIFKLLDVMERAEWITRSDPHAVSVVCAYKRAPQFRVNLHAKNDGLHVHVRRASSAKEAANIRPDGAVKAQRPLRRVGAR